MSELVSPLTLEEYLQDTQRLYILHALDGEIWGTSVAAAGLFGYSSEEMRQLYLASIKPKKLRLSDVCKSQKSENSPVVFERRNNRRFAAQVKTRILKTTQNKTIVDLVLLELRILNTNIVQFPETQQVNIHEATDFLQAYRDELQHSIREIHELIGQLHTTSLTPDQRTFLEQIRKKNSDLSFASESAGDSLMLAMNLLNLERQPFNIVDMLGELFSTSNVKNESCSLCVDRAVPELVYGDEQRLSRTCSSILNRCRLLLAPKQLCIEVQLKPNEKKSESIVFTIKLDGCQIRENTQQKHEDILVSLDSASDIFIAKHLIRMMDGTIKFVKNASDSFEIEFSVHLPEVHDLGLRGNRRFLHNQRIILIDNTHSMLRSQLLTWGAHIEHFRTLGAGLDFLHTHTMPDEEIVIVNIENAHDLATNELDELTQNKSIRTLVIKPKSVQLSADRNISEIPSPYKPAMLGNVLSQFVHTQFPFPYSNSHNKRNKNFRPDRSKLLIVDANENSRNELRDKLIDRQCEIDLAINGIDAVLACAHNRYDLILMDAHLPYMDGIEAITHLRKVSDLNCQTRIIIFTNDTSENMKLSMRQIGVDTLLEKSVSDQVLLDTVQQAPLSNESRFSPEKPAPHMAGRRADDFLKPVSEYGQPVNESVIDRLKVDTDTDVCRDMVDTFIEKSLIALGEVEKSCMAGDWESVARHAQSICNSSLTFGCEALHDLALQLKNESEQNNLGECLRLAAKLPDVFLKSQQSLYTICNRNITGRGES